MPKRNFLLFTNNYAFAILEVSFLGGEVVEKISDHIFIASLPTAISKRQLSYSSFNKPASLQLKEKEIKVLDTWNSWDQSFLAL